MGSVNVFDGKEDVLGWLFEMKAKLISKGYKSVLTDVTRPGVVAVDAKAAWNHCNFPPSGYYQVLIKILIRSV